MPAITPVRIGLGATEVGFEEIGQAMTTDKGELSLTVTVPSWTQPDLTHVFIVSTSTSSRSPCRTNSSCSLRMGQW